MMRIALAGLDSSRPLRVAQHLCTSHGLAALVTDGMRVPDPVRAHLDERTVVVDDVMGVIGTVDVVLDFAHAAARRARRISPLLSAGVHVLTDKPLVLAAGDAVALVARARAHGVRLEADSGYRLALSPEQRRWAAQAVALEIIGPADPHASAGGLAFYGSHHAQLLDELRPDALDHEPEVYEDGADIVARVGDVTLRFSGDGMSGFALGVGDVRHPLAPPSDYLERLIDDFVARCAAGDEVIDERRLVRPIALLERIAARVRE